MGTRIEGCSADRLVVCSSSSITSTTSGWPFLLIYAIRVAVDEFGGLATACTSEKAQDFSRPPFVL